MPFLAIFRLKGQERSNFKMLQIDQKCYTFSKISCSVSCHLRTFNHPKNSLIAHTFIAVQWIKWIK
jgi:hypothetical protein